MTSLWLADRIESATAAGTFEDAGYDVVVIGAGITGLATAVLLARAGKRVAVLEARYVGAGATGNTTGKVSLLQGTKLSRIAGKHGNDVLRAYVAGNTEGRDWLLRYCEDHGLSVQREDAYSYAQSAAGVEDANAELAACRDAGLDAEWISEADVPFPFHGGVRMREQAQLDPLPLLSSLATELETHGGRRFQGFRAESVSGLKPLTITVQPRRTAEDPEPQRLSLITDQVVLATGTPILDRGGSLRGSNRSARTAWRSTCPETSPARCSSRSTRPRGRCGTRPPPEGTS
jgi:glycine/D-amino acid oxidase-like deaminating enzyme